MRECVIPFRIVQWASECTARPHAGRRGGRGGKDDGRLGRERRCSACVRMKRASDREADWESAAGIKERADRRAAGLSWDGFHRERMNSHAGIQGGKSACAGWRAGCGRAFPTTARAPGSSDWASSNRIIRRWTGTKSACRGPHGTVQGGCRRGRRSCRREAPTGFVGAAPSRGSRPEPDRPHSHGPPLQAVPCNPSPVTRSSGQARAHRAPWLTPLGRGLYLPVRPARKWRNGRRAGLRNQWPKAVGVRIPPFAPRSSTVRSST